MQAVRFDSSKATDRLLIHHLQRLTMELDREEVGRNIRWGRLAGKREARPEFPNAAYDQSNAVI